MKKATLITAAIIVLGLTSCVKDYTCECEFTNLVGNTETESYSYDEKSRSEAVDACSEKEEDLNDAYADVDCSIK